jgi:hypothetical protein
MDLYLGATYAAGEPDIAADPESWKAWFNTLNQANKIAWASSYAGRQVDSLASALGIARNYAVAGGAVVGEHMVSPASIAMVSDFRRDQMQKMLLWGGVAAVAYFAFFRRAKRGR